MHDGHKLTPLVRDRGCRAGRSCAASAGTPGAACSTPNVTAFFIILATAVTLHVAGVTNIETAAQAARALRPLAGDFAFILFALGILGVGLIGVPVLAGSAAYALSEAMGWSEGLERKASDARGFYGVIAVAMLVGVGARVLADRPDEGAVLERGDQRRGRRAADGGDHDPGLEALGDGRQCRHAEPDRPGLDRHGGDGVAAAMMFVPS